MVKANFGGDYLSFDNSKDNEMYKIIGKPTPGVLTFQGKDKDVVNIPVSLIGGEGKTKTYTPTNKAGKSMVEAWDEEMDNWIDKTFQVLHVDGKMLIRPKLN